MTDRKKRLRKLLAIKNLDTDISVIIDSQVNQADESFLYKHHRLPVMGAGLSEIFVDVDLGRD